MTEWFLVSGNLLFLSLLEVSIELPQASVLEVSIELPQVSVLEVSIELPQASVLEVSIELPQVSVFTEMCTQVESSLLKLVIVKHTLIKLQKKCV